MPLIVRARTISEMSKCGKKLCILELLKYGIRKLVLSFQYVATYALVCSIWFREEWIQQDTLEQINKISDRILENIRYQNIRYQIEYQNRDFQESILYSIFFLDKIIAAFFYVVEFWSSNHLSSLEKCSHTGPEHYLQTII